MPTEKTLELNITQEILNRLSPPTTWPGWRTTAPPYAIGLSLRDEKRNGWDVKIEFPRLGRRRRYAWFLQFKSGTHKNYSTKPRSIFRPAPAPFCEFNFNDNSTRDQHLVLQALATQPRMRGTVFYAFPRIPNMATFKASIGNLFTSTSLVSVATLDVLASAAGVTISRGNVHKFRTAYLSPFRTEVCSEPIELKGLSMVQPTFFSDVASCLVFDKLEEWRGRALTTLLPSESHQNWPHILDQFLVRTGAQLAIPAADFEKATKHSPSKRDFMVLEEGSKEYAELRSRLNVLKRHARERDEKEREVLPLQDRISILEGVSESVRPYKDLFLKTAPKDWLSAEIPLPLVKSGLPIDDNTSLNFAGLKGRLTEAEFARTLSGIHFQVV